MFNFGCAREHPDAGVDHRVVGRLIEPQRVVGEDVDGGEDGCCPGAQQLVSVAAQLSGEHDVEPHRQDHHPDRGGTQGEQGQAAPQGSPDSSASQHPAETSW